MTVRRMPGQRPEGVDLLPSELVRESSAHSDDLARERLCCVRRQLLQWATPKRLTGSQDPDPALSSNEFGSENLWATGIV
jgi:hypothetical protein